MYTGADICVHVLKCFWKVWLGKISRHVSGGVCVRVTAYVMGRKSINLANTSLLLEEDLKQNVSRLEQSFPP